MDSSIQISFLCKEWIWNWLRIVLESVVYQMEFDKQNEVTWQKRQIRLINMRIFIWSRGKYERNKSNIRNCMWCNE